MMKVDSLMLNEGPSIYYDSAFRNVLEDHMTFLRTHRKTITITVDPVLAYKHEFDFMSLLLAYNVPLHLHWLTMRMNNMVAPTDAKRDLESILIPDISTVDMIRQSHMTTRRLT